MTHSTPLELREPLALDDAREMARLISRQRRAAEKELEQRSKDAAQAEQDYDVAYHQQFVQAEGTAAAREAEAKSNTADLLFRKRLARDMVKVAQARLDGIDGERASMHRLIEFSISLVRATEAQDKPAWSA